MIDAYCAAWNESEETRRRASLETVRFEGNLEILISWFLYVIFLPAPVASALNPEGAFVSSRSRSRVLWLVSVAVQPGLRASR
jgi:hypothetical protein